MELIRKDAVNQVKVGEDGEGQRLDNFLLRHLKGVPKSHVYRIVRSGEVRVNGRRADPTTRLALEDVVRIPPVRLGTTTEAENYVPAAEFQTVYEDEALLAIDKPAGVAVHGGSGVSFGVIEQLRKARPAARFLELVHRLDRETSGLLLIAKKRSALTSLHSMIRDGILDKRYLVLVRGRWPNRRQHVKLPLFKYTTPEGERRVRVDREGLPSHTVFNRLALWESVSLLEAELKTGRTHQIRVHLAHSGFPIAGDEKYGDFAWNRELPRIGLKRMFLHAAQLTLPHPLTGEKLELRAPLPVELQRFIDSLGPAEGAVEETDNG